MVPLNHHKVPSKAQTLLRQALEDLGITNPVLHFSVRGNTITIWFLAMPEPVNWSRPEPAGGTKPTAARRGAASQRPRKASA